MKIITETDCITLSDLAILAKNRFGDMIKAVVDVQKGIMAIDAELHADQEATLLQKGSKQEDVWGINLYPEVAGDDWIEFDSMINVRPSFGNISRSIDNPKIQKEIRKIVERLVQK